MKKGEAIKDLNYYLSLPYTTVLRKDEAGEVVGRIDELAGCVAHGKDYAEALAELESMKRLWVEDCLDSGQTVPEPAADERLPSGKWVQRVPRSLHAKLTRAAREEGVSLNQLVTSILSEQFGTREIQKTIERLMAEISTRQLSHEKSWWDFGSLTGGAEHNWDVGTLFNCRSVETPITVYTAHRSRVGKLIPSKVQLKVENAIETNPEEAIAHRR
jgi:antitoxin HicB